MRRGRATGKPLLRGYIYNMVYGERSVALFRLFRGGRGLRLFQHVLVVEEENGDGAARDGGIGKVENRAEEHFAAHKRQPVGPGEEREVEHIYHAPREETAVALAEGGEGGGVEGYARHVGQAFGEDEPIEAVVDDVARRAGDDERDAKNKSERLQMLCRPAQDKAEEDDGRDAEHGEHRRADEVHTEGHTPVFDKYEFEPRGHVQAFVQEEMRLNVDLDDLVYDDNRQNSGGGEAKAFVGRRKGHRYG